MNEDERMKEFDLLSRIADSFPEDSGERRVLELAGNALHFSKSEETKKRFEQFLESTKKPLNGILLIHMKMCGLEIPEHLRTQAVIEIESEIDRISEKFEELNDNQSA